MQLFTQFEKYGDLSPVLACVAITNELKIRKHLKSKKSIPIGILFCLRQLSLDNPTQNKRKIFKFEPLEIELFF